MNYTDTLAAYSGLLGIIQPYAPEAHIAGGAIRDLLCGRPIKDVDVFVGHRNFKKAHFALLNAGYNHDRNGSEDYDYFNPETFVTDVADYSGNVLPSPVQVIGLSDHIRIEGILERFDFGFSMAAFDGERVIQTRQFREDDVNMRFTLINCRSYDHYLLAREHYARLQDKYPDRELVIPPQYQKYVAEEEFMKQLELDL